MGLDVINEGIDPELFQVTVNDFMELPLYQLLGFQLTRVGSGYVQISFKADTQHINIRQSVHGGIIAVLVDAAMGTAIRSAGIRGVTIDLTTHYLAPAHYGDLVAVEGRVVSAGQKIIIAEAEVILNSNRLMARTRASFYNEGFVQAVR